MRTQQKDGFATANHREKESLALEIVNKSRQLVEMCENDSTLHFMAYAAELQSEEVYNSLVRGEIMN